MPRFHINFVTTSLRVEKEFLAHPPKLMCDQPSSFCSDFQNYENQQVRFKIICGFCFSMHIQDSLAQVLL